jgi:alpha-L-arabinofuranosidase
MHISRKLSNLKHRLIARSRPNIEQVKTAMMTRISLHAASKARIVVAVTRSAAVTEKKMMMMMIIKEHDHVHIAVAVEKTQTEMEMNKVSRDTRVETVTMTAERNIRVRAVEVAAAADEKMILTVILVGNANTASRNHHHLRHQLQSHLPAIVRVTAKKARAAQRNLPL